ncbi:hypothetical protein PM082_020409 [Marasmius tenuissimus]|nr:hypothetical protein PM082_020409 [Marasmius tenuissimus]
MVVVLARLSSGIAIVEADPPLALLVVNSYNSNALFTRRNGDRDELTSSGGFRLAPATLSTDLDTKEVDFGFVGVFPGVGSGHLTTDLGRNVGRTWVVTVGDWGTELEPSAAVGEITLLGLS